MATAAKKAAAEPENPNLVIWDAVSKTDPANTKRVNQRGGFTAIAAHSQILEATRQFGPIGVGWGYTSGEPVFHDTLLIVPVTLWHGKRENTFGPVYGGAEWKNNKGHLDSDAAKKATTDGLTKALSQLGFNADVFLGRFDDNKYVEQARKEFGGPPANDANGNGHSKTPARDNPFPQGPAKNRTELKTLGRAYWRDVEGAGDSDSLDIVLDTSRELHAQLAADLPSWLTGWEKDGQPYEGLTAVIERKRAEFADDSWHDNPLLGG